MVNKIAEYICIEFTGMKFNLIQKNIRQFLIETK